MAKFDFKWAVCFDIYPQKIDSCWDKSAHFSLSDSFVYYKITLGVVHERVGMKPIRSAASDSQYCLNLAPLFHFLRKIYLGSAKICRCCFCALLLEHQFFLFP